MPLAGGLPPLPNLPNLNLPLPDLSSVSLPVGSTGKHICFLIWLHVILKCFFPLFPLSSPSGISPSPQHPRPGPLTHATNHASLPAASRPPSGRGPAPARFHSLGYSHGGQRGCGRRPHTPHGSCLNQCQGITSAHGNNANIVIEEISYIVRSKHTPGFSLSLSHLVFLFLFIWPWGDPQTAAPVQTQGSASSRRGWGWL